LELPIELSDLLVIGRSLQRAAIAGAAAGVLVVAIDSRLINAQRAGESSRPWTCWVMSGATSILFSSPVTDRSCLLSSDPVTASRGLARRSFNAQALAAPGTPIGLAAAISGRTVSLTWTPGAGDSATSYLLEAGSASGQSDLAAFDTGSAIPTLTATDVPPGVYFVRVRARNASGTSAPSNEVVASVLGACAGAPGAPTGLTATTNGASVALRWQAPTGSCPATTYVIEAGSGPGLSNLASFSTGSTLTTFSASGVPSGSYYLRVRSGNASGASAPSNEVVMVVGQASSEVNLFSPNAATIATSEGAPYGSTDIFFRTSYLETSSAYGYGPTKVLQAYICLNAVVAFDQCSQRTPPTGPLPLQMLDAIGRGIASYAGTGVKLLVRFTYNFGPLGASDAPIDVIATHIDQLAPILLQNKDLIFALEAGFIGTWGEWHHSTSGNDDPGPRRALLQKLFLSLGGAFPILVRYPADAIAAGGTTPPSGLGIHDDFFASNAVDGGTWNFPNYYGFPPSQLMAYGAQASLTTMFVGEFGFDTYPQLQDCAPLDRYSYQFNVQSIALHVGNDAVHVQNSLQAQGCITAFYNKVGVRIELQGSTLQGNLTPGGTLAVSVTLRNAGYGRVIRPRPVTLVLLASGSVVAQLPVALADLDLRQLLSAQTPTSRTFQFSVALPPNLPLGTISTALAIQDPSPSLAFQPAYALPLNSVDQNNNSIFDRTTGYNLIGAFTSR
jgi:hypothetical protein